MITPGQGPRPRACMPWEGNTRLHTSETRMCRLAENRGVREVKCKEPWGEPYPRTRQHTRVRNKSGPSSSLGSGFRVHQDSDMLKAAHWCLSADAHTKPNLEKSSASAHVKSKGWTTTFLSMLKPNKRERPLFRVPELLWFLLQSVLHQSMWLQHADQCPAHKADATNTGRDRLHQASSGTSPFPDYYASWKFSSTGYRIHLLRKCWLLGTLTGLVGGMRSKAKP